MGSPAETAFKKLNALVDKVSKSADAKMSLYKAQLKDFIEVPKKFFANMKGDMETINLMPLIEGSVLMTDLMLTLVEDVKEVKGELAAQEEEAQKLKNLTLVSEWIGCAQEAALWDLLSPNFTFRGCLDRMSHEAKVCRKMKVDPWKSSTLHGTVAEQLQKVGVRVEDFIVGSLTRQDRNDGVHSTVKLENDNIAYRFLEEISVVRSHPDLSDHQKSTIERLMRFLCEFWAPGRLEKIEK